MIRVRRLPPIDDDGIPMAAFLDIIFLLIIFFFAAGLGDPKNAMIPINLPTADPTQIREIATAHQPRIEIDAGGRIFLDGVTVTLDELSRALKKPVPASVLIAADRLANHGSVVNVLVTAKTIGIENYSFEVTAGR